MQHEITVTQAEPEEAESIVDFQILMAKETENLQLEKETVNKGVLHIFDNPQTGFYILARAQNKIIASLLVLKEWSDWRNGNVLWVHSVYVVPEYRKQGVFRKMYHHIKSMVEADNSLKGIRLYVEKKNHKAQAVYQRVGMTAEHYELYEWLKDY